MKNFLADIKNKAKESGWRFEQTTSGHWKFFSPDGITIILVSGTPSDWRVQRKVTSDFKRAGLVLGDD